MSSVWLLLDRRISLSNHACAQANSAHSCSKASVKQSKFERVEKSFFTNLNKKDDAIVRYNLSNLPSQNYFSDGKQFSTSSLGISKSHSAASIMRLRVCFTLSSANMNFTASFASRNNSRFESSKHEAARAYS